MSFEDPQVYQCKSGLLPGKNYAAVVKVAWRIFNGVCAKSKRRPYIRSAYFGGEKIFLDNFWPHLLKKNLKDRYRRIRYLGAAMELLRNSRRRPATVIQDKPKNCRYFRFMGRASDRLFAVQVKEDLKRNQKFFMSCFGTDEK